MLRRLAGLIGLALLLAALPLVGINALEEDAPEDPVAINPLTGLPAAEPEYLLRNPVIAKVSNAAGHRAATRWPRSGRPRLRALCRGAV